MKLSVVARNNEGKAILMTEDLVWDDEFNSNDNLNAIIRLCLNNHAKRIEIETTEEKRK